MKHHFAQIVEARLKALNTNAFAVEHAHGLPPHSIRNVLRSDKKSGPILTKAEEICRALGLEITLGPRPHRATGLSGFPAAADFNPRTALVQLHWPYHLRKARSDLAPIACTTAWFKDNDLNPDSLSVVAPDVAPNAPGEPKQILAVVDRSARRLPQTELWAFTDQKRIAVARVRHQTTMLVIHPGDAGWSVRVFYGAERNAMIVLGRVVWIGCRDPMGGTR